MTRAADLQLPPVATGVMRWKDDGAATLLGGVDPATGRCEFPARRGSDNGSRVDVGGEGVLHAFTTIHTRPPFGLPTPYSVGYVDLDQASLRVFALVSGGGSGTLRRGAPMRLFARAMGNGLDGKPCLRPVFEVAPSAIAGEGAARG